MARVQWGTPLTCPREGVGTPFLGQKFTPALGCEADPSHEKQYSENGHNWPRVQPCFLVKAYIYKTVNLFFWPGVPGDVIFGPLNISFSDF